MPGPRRVPDVKTAPAAAAAPRAVPRPAGPAAPAQALEAAQSEHIYIGSEDVSRAAQTEGLTVRERTQLRNPLRRTSTEVTFYEEGVLEVIEHVRGKRGETFRLDLQYLDPIPSITLVVAKRALKASAGCAAVSAAALLLAKFAALHDVALWVALAAALAAVAAAAVGLYRSRETTEFRTIHGRARVLSLVASVGSIKRFRAFVPELSRAIEESAERITNDTSAYLRAEMREHYRLRGDGVLSAESCADSTGRILAQFDVQL